MTKIAIIIANQQEKADCICYSYYFKFNYGVTSILLYKAKEFVCLFERANFRNYWFDLKKSFCVR